MPRPTAQLSTLLTNARARKRTSAPRRARAGTRWRAHTKPMRIWRHTPPRVLPQNFQKFREHTAGIKKMTAYLEHMEHAISSNKPTNNGNPEIHHQPQTKYMWARCGPVLTSDTRACCNQFKCKREWEKSLHFIRAISVKRLAEILTE